MTDGGSQSGWTVVAETLCCAHCGGHWIPEPGSGRSRGYCTNCKDWLCGMPRCMASCVPEEQMLERMEANGARDLHAALNDAERVGELLVVGSDAAFAQMVGALYAQRQQGIEYRARIEANIRAIRGV